MKASNKTAGFSIVEAILIVAILAVIGYVGWRVWEAQQSVGTASTNNSTQTAQVPTTAPDIKSASDLDKASSTVDQMNLDSNSQDLTNMQKELNSL